MVIWWLLERRSGAIQQQVWLQEHADFAALALRRLNMVVAMTAWFVAKRPASDGMALMEGRSLPIRRAASDRAKAHIALILAGNVNPWGPQDEQGLTELLGEHYGAVESVLQEYGAVFDQLPHVRAAVVDYRERCVMRIPAHAGISEIPTEGNWLGRRRRTWLRLLSESAIWHRQRWLWREPSQRSSRAPPQLLTLRSSAGRAAHPPPSGPKGRRHSGSVRHRGSTSGVVGRSANR